jgi:nucleotide-binding universal stress UspA family protein
MEHEKGFRRILLATDGSLQADAAVDATIRMARFTGAIVRVLHVWSLDVHHREGFWDVETQAQGDRLVDDAVSRLTRAGVMAEKEMYQADGTHVAAAIATVARQFEADLVVIGSRGLTDWQSIFQHSVSHQVLAALDCPVLVVRSGEHVGIGQTQKILLAVAGGHDVAPAVRAAISVSQSHQPTVLVVHVAQAIIGAQGFAYVESEAEINDTLAAATSQLRDARIPVESMVLHSGPVASRLIEVATSWNADLIVVGSSRMGDVTGLLLGSVSHQLMHESEVPVLIAERVKA